MMTDEQIRKAAKYCPFTHSIVSKYCMICPYNSLGEICIRALRHDLNELLDRVISDVKENLK